MDLPRTNYKVVYKKRKKPSTQLDLNQQPLECDTCALPLLLLNKNDQKEINWSDLVAFAFDLHVAVL